MREEEPFKLIKGLLTSGSPIPAVVFLGEVKERVSNGGVVRYEPTVEVGKAKEGAHVLDFGWGQPGSNIIEFDRVHGADQVLQSFQDIQLLGR